jgi:cytochrome c biogenesis protein CcdA
MKDVFAQLYELMKSFYGSNLADHLYGIDEKGDFSRNALYSTVGVIMLLTTIFGVAMYYFFLNSYLNTARYSKGSWWAGVLLACLGFNFFMGFYLPYLDKDNGNIVNVKIAESVDNQQFIGFGFANLIWSLLLFLLLSFSVKRWSTNASTTPF